MDEAQRIIRELGLEPLTVEGGFFKETYRAEGRAEGGTRRNGTCIYYMMRGADISRWHKVASDEIWLYHAGTPAAQLLLFPDGSFERRVIGPDVLAGQRPQSLIPAGTWQAAVLLKRDAGDWGLFGAVVCPGFEYADFQEGSSAELAKAHPAALAEMRSMGLA